MAGPVIEVPPTHDIMFHTRNCKTVHDYLNKDQYDVKRLEDMLNEEFTPELISQTRQYLQTYFNKEINTLRQ